MSIGSSLLSLCFWLRACVYWIFLSVSLQCSDINTTMYFTPCCIMFPVLLFPPSNFWTSFPLCMFLRVFTCFSAWRGWCCYFKFVLFFCFVDIRSNNTLSDVLLFTECSYWFLWKYCFEVDVVFNLLIIFFSKYLELMFHYWMPSCNHHCLFVLVVLYLW